MEWLPSFLKRTFFGACSVHQDNDLNRYCMTCHVAACKDCAASGSHGEHNLLKIYRHVYKDVVPLEDMRAYINCDMIQPYRCNKKMVISLNPLPHCGSGKTDNGSCNFCMRKLTDSKNYHYCSIACKVRHDPLVEEDDPEEEDESQKPKRHRRKGIPRRAAF